MITETKINNKQAFREHNTDEPEWLYNLRREAWDRYQEFPLPSKVEHLWKYTRPNWFLPEDQARQMVTLPVKSEIESNEIAPMNQQFAGFGCNHGNRVNYTQVNPELKSAGLIYCDLQTAILNHGDLVQKYLGKLIGTDFGKFEALNTAFWNTGLFLYVPPGMQVDKPIYMHRHPNSSFNMPRLLIVADVNSHVTIIDDYAGKSNGTSFTAYSAVEIFAEKASQVRYISPQNLDSSVRSFVTQRARAEQDSQVYSIFVSLGSDISKINIGTILTGRGANSQTLGILFGNKKQHFDHHTLHHHMANDTYSNIDFKVVLKDKALSAYTGKIKIEEYTENCEAYQENRNLLLSKDARTESIPELEILNNQVSCSHGATMGPIDPEMVFYLKSRGISKDAAVRIIVSGFVEPLMKLVPEELRQMMLNLVEHKMLNQ
jgi:Fe-S cluster assembly protein SufD